MNTKSKQSKQETMCVQTLTNFYTLFTDKNKILILSTCFFFFLNTLIHSMKSITQKAVD